MKILSYLYLAITTVRNYLFDIGFFNQYKSNIPIISVGNIHAGGTGKTPTVIYIAKLLLELGFSPVVLSRGYGGKEEGLVTKNSDPVLFGDEPTMIANKLGISVVVAKKRVDGAKKIESDKMGDIIILDDGLQHRYIKRDVEIILLPIDSEEIIIDFELNKILPFGKLRESRYQALKRATAVIFTARSSTNYQDKIDRFGKFIPSSIPKYISSIDKIEVKNNINQILIPQRVHLISGIANPESFETTMKKAGFEVISHTKLTDHVIYNKQHIDSILTLSKEYPVVCTEKDWVKLQKFQGIEISRCEIEYIISAIGDSINFRELIKK